MTKKFVAFVLLSVALQSVVPLDAQATTETLVCGNASTAVSDAKYYSPLNSTSECAGAVPCWNAFCACATGNASMNSTDGRMCLHHNTSVSCAAKYACMKELFLCLLNAAELAHTTCGTWAVLIHLELLLISGGVGYHSTPLRSGCELQACGMLWANASARVLDHRRLTLTTQGQNYVCPPQPSAYCISPLQVKARLRLSGLHWKKVLENATSVGELTTATTLDLSDKLLYNVTVDCFAEGSLLANFSVPTGENEYLTARFKSASTSSDWIARIQAVYATYGGTDAIVVLGIDLANGTSYVNPDYDTPAPTSPTTSVPVNPNTAVPYEDMPEKKNETLDQLAFALLGVIAFLSLVVAALVLRMCCCKRSRSDDYKVDRRQAYRHDPYR